MTIIPDPYHDALIRELEHAALKTGAYRPAHNNANIPPLWSRLAAALRAWEQQPGTTKAIIAALRRAEIADRIVERVRRMYYVPKDKREKYPDGLSCDIDEYDKEQP